MFLFDGILIFDEYRDRYDICFDLNEYCEDNFMEEDNEDGEKDLEETEPDEV